MSLAIVKVDREKKTHSIYAEGISLSGGEIVSQTSQKVYSKSLGSNVSILSSHIGTKDLDRFFEIYLYDKLTKKFLSNANSNYFLASEELTDIYNQLFKTYCGKRNLDLNNLGENWTSYSGILSINGDIYHVHAYHENSVVSFNAQHIDDDFFCIGQETQAVKALHLYGCNDTHKMIEIVSKINNKVGTNIFCYENISYEKSKENQGATQKR